MTQRTRHVGVIPFLALYTAAALFVLPWMGPVASQEDEQETPRIDPTRIADYDIQVQLDAEAKQLIGSETITWTNAGTAPTQELQFHLYMNAFRSADTHFFEHRDDWREEDAGWIDVTGLALTDGSDLLPTANVNETVMSAALPEPAAPGAVLHIDVAFRVQLPRAIERAGYSDDFFFVAQWFPKLGVYLDDRWICPQYTTYSEFYADFGRYRVEITTPRNMEVGATGIRERARTEANSKTLIYTAYPVHDFAWTASPLFRRSREQMNYTAADGTPGTLDVHLLLHRDRQFLQERYMAAVRRTLEAFTKRYGPFPYPKLVVVDPPPGRGRAAGGMEYPMLITGGSSWFRETFMTGDKDIEDVTAHEFAHQYWYAAVANNEFEEPWIDEGVTTFTSSKVIDSFGPHSGSLSFPVQLGTTIMGLHPFRWDLAFEYHDLTPLLRLGLRDSRLAEDRRRYLSSPNAAPITAPAYRHYVPISYGVSAYSKPRLALMTLENIIGEEALERALRRFQELFRFRHATGADFRAVINEVAGTDLSWFFDQVWNGTQSLDYAVASIEDDTVTLERRGGVRVPQQIDILLSDGSDLPFTWDPSPNEHPLWMEDFQPLPGNPGVEHRIGEGQNGRWLRIQLKGAAEIIGAVVDPEYRYLLDINLANNSFRAETDTELADRASQSWTRIMARWLHGVSAYN